MTPATSVLVLAATVAAGGAGFGAASLVSLITQAPRLRYLAYSAALIFSLLPFLSGAPMPSAPGASYAKLAGLAPAAVQRWVGSAPVDDWLWRLAEAAPSILAIYAVGAAICIIRLALRWAALRRILSSAWPADLKAFGGGRPMLSVRVSDGVRSALLIGVRRPVAVLPAQALAQMDASQLGWVLAHEAAHARRSDNLRLLAEETLRAVLWFNPFVAWAAIGAADAREQLCDQTVLQNAGPSSRWAYAETLLLAFRLGSQPEITSSLISPGRRRHVLRIQSILTPVRLSLSKTLTSGGLVAVAGLIAFVVGASAWAGAPKTTDSPWDIRADRVMTSGCETVFSGNASARQSNLNVRADLLRLLFAGKPKACGRLIAVDAYGDVVAENQGQVKRGQVAHVDPTTSTIAMK